MLMTTSLSPALSIMKIRLKRMEMMANLDSEIWDQSKILPTALKRITLIKTKVMTVDFLAVFWRPVDLAVTDMAMATVTRIISLRSREPVRITCRDSQVGRCRICQARPPRILAFQMISCTEVVWPVPQPSICSSFNNSF